MHSAQVRSFDLDLTVRRTCGERRRRWRWRLKKPSLPKTSSRRRCIRVRRGSQRFCPISLREFETGIYLARKRLTGTCGMHCRVRATENVGQRVRRAVRSFVRSFVRSRADKTERASIELYTCIRIHTRPGVNLCTGIPVINLRLTQAIRRTSDAARD